MSAQPSCFLQYLKSKLTRAFLVSEHCGLSHAWQNLQRMSCSSQTDRACATATHSSTWLKQGREMFGSTFKLQPNKPFLASQLMALAYPTAAVMQHFLLGSQGCWGFRRKAEGRRKRWEIIRSLVTAALWKRYFAGLLFWHRFHKVGFGVSLVI